MQSPTLLSKISSLSNSIVNLISAEKTRLRRRESVSGCHSCGGKRHTGYMISANRVLKLCHAWFIQIAAATIFISLSVNKLFVIFFADLKVAILTPQFCGFLAQFVQSLFFAFQVFPGSRISLQKFQKGFAIITNLKMQEI